MPNKTLRMYCQVKSQDQSKPVELSIVANRLKQKVHVMHTDDWQLTDDATGSASIDLLLDTEKAGASKPVANLILTPTGGDVLVVGFSENYTAAVIDNPEYDPSDPYSEKYITQKTGNEFTLINQTTDIVAQPMINGSVDLLRYNFSDHYGGGFGGGDLGAANFAIYDGETGIISVQYSFYCN